MRVISGIYKRRRFDIPKNFKARPTTDFAKENLFNVLSNKIDFEEQVKALDLFAGTGSISLELVSRGCRQVVSVEKDPVHYAFIRKVCQEIGAPEWVTLKGDVFRFVENCAERFGFIFADPPYDLRELDSIPDKIFDKGLLEENGLLVLEHSSKNRFESHPYFLDHREYGSVNFSFFSKQRGEQSDDRLDDSPL